MSDGKPKTWTRHRQDTGQEVSNCSAPLLVALSSGVGFNNLAALLLCRIAHRLALTARHRRQCRVKPILTSSGKIETELEAANAADHQEH